MSAYVGRFAPSPSGPLHLGSLFTATVSYLDAKAHDGLWLLRIEDIDPPREMPGASQLIIETLEIHGMVSDLPVFWQHERLVAYRATLDSLLGENKAYFCQCTRSQIKANHPLYQGQCRQAYHSFGAIRWHNEATITEFIDRWHGLQQAKKPMPHQTLIGHSAFEDCVLQRKDGLVAYNLAVVLDDIAQGITHIVRGTDLLPTTLLQLNLWESLTEQSIPNYAHCPVLVTKPGKKLSKQNHAPALDNTKPLDNLRNVFALLGLHSNATSINGLLADGIQQWRVNTPEFQQEMIVERHINPYDV